MAGRSSCPPIDALNHRLCAYAPIANILSKLSIFGKFNFINADAKRLKRERMLRALLRFARTR